MTFKQLEALYWIAQLGGFSAAALKLHTTQSAVSKRVQELELLFDTELFDRSQRSARLTEKGEEMFVLAKKLLEQRDAAIEQFSRPEVIERRVRISVTEMTALTWLPQLVNLIQRYYPKVVIEPDVDNAISLRDKLLADEVDLIVLPDAFEDTRFSSKVLGSVEYAWMCKPGMLDSSKRLRVHELATHRLLVQGEKSGTGLLYARWFKALGFQPASVITSSNLVALIGMTVSGLGVSYLPRQCLDPLVAAGMLDVIKTTPAPPAVTYVALHKGGQRSTLVSSIILMAQECCDFTRMLQTSKIAPGAGI
ncbi:LysR family transcriptional regulator [Ramlibacter sp. WS9]|uniref:LysR family transcriptional regulator n=1 Tax=Ramlibacter sp. WS9 TaxID=1882741 RepID=UPI001142F592|nr:LysR family transcriptional regulator [Ramlibacter sp. WS9]ROZ78084.1 LysR family transcriptional regulator [Ramlibacter sp. WS9]HSV36673.1 LysR family transcriptional regulator [Ramlibacter sp.]